MLVGAMGEETNAEAFHAIPTQMIIDFVILHCIIIGSMIFRKLSKGMKSKQCLGLGSLYKTITCNEYLKSLL